MNASVLLFQAGQRSAGSQVLPSSSEAAGEAVLKDFKRLIMPFPILSFMSCNITVCECKVVNPKVRDK